MKKYKIIDGKWVQVDTKVDNSKTSKVDQGQHVQQVHDQSLDAQQADEQVHDQSLDVQQADEQAQNAKVDDFVAVKSKFKSANSAENVNSMEQRDTSKDESREKLSDAQPPKSKEINILLLGETGVGKSTWINAIANYLNFDTLEEAIKGEMVVQIPSHFTMTNDNYEEVTIKVGQSNDNEVHKDGESSTQQPITYKFPIKDMTLRIIDTPGIGDTRGIKQDKENFQLIMNHISHVPEIHGICVLLKPNNARLSIFFEFCIKELLTQLHKDTANNIVFCFTNARSTFYRPGDTLTSLKALLTEKGTKPIIVPLEKRTIYCLDNESFRFLAAVKNNQEFGEDETTNFSNSWKTSVKETGRMIEYFQALKPHNTKHTVTLNATRQIIIKLAQPLAEVTQQIQTNIALLDDKAKELNNLYDTEKDLMGKLTIPQIDLEAFDLNYPKTVCADPKCTTSISVHKTSDNQQILKTEYTQVCHNNCSITGVPTNQLHMAELRGCAAMRNNVCRHCAHGYEKHMHITYETRRVLVNVIDRNVESALYTNEQRKKATKELIDECQARKAIYESEQSIINKTGAQFAVFLKENSITPYNNAIIRYLEYMIELEEEKVNIGGVRSTLDQLRKSKQVYEEEEKLIKDAIKSSAGHNITLDDVQKSLKNLYSLKMSGATIKKFLEKAELGAQKFNYVENKWTPTPTAGKTKSEQGLISRLGGWFAKKVG